MNTKILSNKSRPLEYLLNGVCDVDYGFSSYKLLFKINMV